MTFANPTLAIRNTTIIDATGADPVHHATLLVGGDGRIAALGPNGEVEVPSAARTIDGTGAFLIPGLMDANVHLVAARTPDTLLEFEGRFHELALEAAELTLKYGVTTVFDTWGPAEPVTEVRDRINAGEAVGSRVFCAGNIIGLGGPLSRDFVAPGTLLERETVARINHTWERGTGPNLLTRSVEQIEDAVAAYLEETDVDFLKWAATDHLAEAGSMTFHLFSERAQLALQDTARRYGKTTQAHTTTVDSLRISVDLGVDVLQHGDMTVGQTAPEELLDRIADAGIPTAALVCTREYLDWSETSPAAAGHRKMRRNSAVNQRGLLARNARMLLTTDGFAYGPRISQHPGFRAGTLTPEVPDLPVQLGFSHINWIKGAFQLGMDPMEVLRSATSYPATAYRIDGDLGTLERGKVADILMLNADPLSGAAAYTEIREVIKAGQLIDRERLARDLHLGADLRAEFAEAGSGA